MRRLFVAVAVLAGLSACGGGETGAGPTDAGGGGGATACAAAYAGCQSYVAPDGGTAVVDFGGTLGNAYAPKCLKVAKGTTVTFNGAFGTHPLAQGCGPAATITNGSGATKAITFDNAGTFGYYCTSHGQSAGSGMAGSIEVTP